MKPRPHGEPVLDPTNLREEWRTACHKLKLGMLDPKTRSYRGAQLHDFRRTAASNMNAKGIQEGKAMTVTGHKTNSNVQTLRHRRVGFAARRARRRYAVIEFK